MAFSRPTLDQIIDRVKTSIKGELQITTILRRSFLGALSKAVALLSHTLHGHLDYISKQALPDTAEDENLERWANIWGVKRKQATFAELNITITGSEGETVPINREYQTEDGRVYTLKAEVTIPAEGSIEGTILAETSGSTHNLEVGDVVSLRSPIADVDGEATVASVVTEAEDTETNDSLRSRLINRLQLPPLGGSANDYIQWALEVAGVTRAWVLPLYTGAGTVAVSFVEDDEDPIIPSAAKVTEMQAYIDEKKPVTALLTVFAPVAAPMDMTISIKPNTSEVQENITDQLEDLIKREATLAGSYKGPGETNDGSLLLSKIRQAIAIAVGVEDYEIETINGAAPANVVPADGELITLGTITWQPLA